MLDSFYPGPPPQRPTTAPKQADASKMLRHLADTPRHYAGTLAQLPPRLIHNNRPSHITPQIDTKQEKDQDIHAH